MTMDNKVQQIEVFFRKYEEGFNRSLNGEMKSIETTEAFADYIVGAGPAGVNGGKNDDQFREMIEKGYEFYISIGITSMKILSIDVNLLDNLHAMAKIRWSSNFIRKDMTTGSIEFDVFYILQDTGKGNKIFAYITGDEQSALRESGLI